MANRKASHAARLPAVHVLARHALLADIPRALVLEGVRGLLDEVRLRILTGEVVPPGLDELARQVVDRVQRAEQPAVRRVINATGVVLHTNLGRAPLGPVVAQAVQEAVAGYSTVEMDMDSGGRGDRLHRLRELLIDLTGAEDAVVVNNNAAAVLLALTALARGSSVIISRGELVEIGGSFRIPDVAEAGGARLLEVGTTNRTRLADFERAIEGGVVGLLSVHPSNYRIVGFTERASREDLARLARSRGLWFMEDLGSGNLLPEVPGEPTVREVVSSGAHLVTFSGDKLLGGPQAGIAVGDKALVRAMRHHPLYRALRLDKLVIAALDATLRLHRAGRSAEVPAIAMLGLPVPALRARAQVWLRALEDLHVQASCEAVEGRAGAGSLPEQPLRSYALVIRGLPLRRLARLLREGDPPVIGRIHRDALHLDPRTVNPEQDELLVEQLREAITTLQERV